MSEKSIKKLTEGSFNISKTAYRINENGEVSQKPISKKVKKQNDHPYLNFGKNGKIIFRSSPKDSFQEAVRTFQAVHEVAIRTLNDDEYLWTKDSLLEDQESGIYFSFSFPQNFTSQIETEGIRESIEVKDLYRQIESVYSLLSEKFYERLGIVGVTAKDSLLEVQFRLDHREPETIDFEKVKVSHYILLSLLFYEEGSSVDLLDHTSSFFKRINISDETQKQMKKLWDSGFLLSEEKRQRKEVIGKLKEFYQTARRKPYQLKGYEEMEISTQILIFDAIRMGISYEILDEDDHLLRLQADRKTEYVQQATRTGLVSYISSIIMENKHVSKLLLEENNFSVPKGSMYTSSEEAMRDYERYKGEEIVVKPKSTNKGIGISIFKPVREKEAFKQAIARAFLEDTTILIEEFISGVEYRFFVLDGKCRDVLLRVPANVKGDGEHTVEELVSKKNKDANRGYGGRSPLEIIEIAEVEELTLSQQGFDSSYIPEKDEVVYLRENSNISTGGDSISFLDEMDDSYIKVAEEITRTLDAKVCGIDLIIPDHQTPSTISNPGYHFLEGNANPGMYAHMFVAEGKGVRLTMHLLDSLFPDLDILNEETEIDV